MVEVYSVSSKAIRSELDGLLMLLKKKGFSLNQIASIGQITTPKGKQIAMKSSYISLARSNEKANYYSEIFDVLCYAFRVHCKIDSVTFKVFTQDILEFEEQLRSIREGSNADSNGSQVTVTNNFKNEFFEGTSWCLYTRTSKGIQRHKLVLSKNGKAAIFNAEPRKNYEGKWYFESLSYLVMTFHHHKTKDKSLHMLFYVGRGENPELCLGVFINSGDTGGRTYASTCVLTILDNQDNEFVPKTVEWHSLEIEGTGDEVPLMIYKYLRDKELNQISTPGKGIRSLANLQEWYHKKNSLNLDVKLPHYIGVYMIYYFDDEELIELELEIYQDDFSIMGEIIQGKRVREFGIGEIMRYERLLQLTVVSDGRPVYLQLDIGGNYTSEYECYRGLISGLTYTEEELVTYPVVVIKSLLLKDDQKKKIFLAKLNALKEAGDLNPVYAKSPRRFKIINL